MPGKTSNIIDLFEHDKRYVMLSGGPASGKSSILREIMEIGILSIPEAARYVIADWQRQDIPLPWEDDPKNKRKDKNLDADIAQTQQRWLQNANNAINIMKSGDNGPILTLMQNATIMEMTEIAFESIQNWKISAQGQAYKEAADLLIKHAHYNIPNQHESSQLPYESVRILQSVCLPVNALSERIRAHLHMTTSGLFSGIELVKAIKIYGDRIGTKRFIKHKALHPVRRSIIIMDRGLLDPLAFNEEFLKSIQSAIFPESRVSHGPSTPLREAAPYILRAGYAAGTALGSNVEHVINALQQKGNITFFEIEPLPLELYAVDAQRHEDYDQAQQQHKKLLLAYQPFSRTGKSGHVPSLTTNKTLMTPRKRAEQALDSIEKLLPHYRLETASSFAKKQEIRL